MPEIQLKLDSILALVQMIIECQQESQGKPLEQDLGQRYAQRIIIFVFEQFKNEKIKIDSYDCAFGFTKELIEGYLKEFNTYVLEAMVRECLISRTSATEIVHKHWGNLVL